MSTIIKEAADASDFAICMAIRMEVFVKEQGVPLEEEMDEFDATSTHYLMRLDGAPIATARTRVMEDGTGRIERVAVRKEHRGDGQGEQMVEHLIVRLRNHPKVKKIQLTAQTNVLEFYEKLGFSRDGVDYVEAGIPHCLMVLSSPN